VTVSTISRKPYGALFTNGPGNLEISCIGKIEVSFPARAMEGFGIVHG